jgi:hypothetical protein
MNPCFLARTPRELPVFSHHASANHCFRHRYFAQTAPVREPTRTASFSLESTRTASFHWDKPAAAPQAGFPDDLAYPATTRANPCFLPRTAGRTHAFSPKTHLGLPSPGDLANSIRHFPGAWPHYGHHGRAPCFWGGLTFLPLKTQLGPPSPGDLANFKIALPCLGYDLSAFISKGRPPSR